VHRPTKARGSALHKQMSPIQNPALDDFLRRARHEFHFLVVEFGFQEQTIPKRRGGNPYEVRYRSGTTLVIVEGINWGYGVNVLLGPARQPIFRSEDTFHSGRLSSSGDLT
jgi:hypothetical protein